MSCDKKQSSTCAKKVNAKCVDYEGSFHTDSELEVCDKPNMEAVIEDMNTTLNEITSSIDLSQLDSSCIEYDPAGEKLQVWEALNAHAEKICELVEHTGLGEPEPCPECGDPCANSGTTCCDPLIYLSQLNTQLDITKDGGQPLLSGSVVLLPDSTVSKLTPVDLLIEEAGTYIVHADFTLEYGGAVPISGTRIGTLYEFRVGGVLVPYSTRYVKVDTGTPANFVNTFSVTSVVTTSSDNNTLELWFNVDPAGDNTSALLITSCTVTATKKRTT